METLLSPLLAAAALAVVSYSSLFGATAFGFGVSAVLVAATAVPPVARRAGSRFGTRLALGVRLFRRLLRDAAAAPQRPRCSAHSSRCPTPAGCSTTRSPAGSPPPPGSAPPGRSSARSRWPRRPAPSSPGRPGPRTRSVTDTTTTPTRATSTPHSGTATAGPLPPGRPRRHPPTRPETRLTWGHRDPRRPRPSARIATSQAIPIAGTPRAALRGAHRPGPRAHLLGQADNPGYSDRRGGDG